jgi:hypothetical protein
MTDDEMRAWARDLKALAANKGREARILERRADAVLARLAERQSEPDHTNGSGA